MNRKIHKINILLICHLLALSLCLPSVGSSADQQALEIIRPVQLKTEGIRRLPGKTPVEQEKLPVKIAPKEIKELKAVSPSRDLRPPPTITTPMPQIITETPSVQDPEDGLGERKPTALTTSYPTEEDPEGKLGLGRSSRQRPPCFIATAAYGSPMAEKIIVLANFRDEYLLKHSLGRFLVAVYYKNSPPVADFIARHESLRAATRAVLWPIVYAISHTTYAAVFLVISAIMMVGFVIFRRQAGKAHRVRG